MSGPLEQIRAPRVAWGGAATVYLGNQQLRCEVANLSASGMLLLAPQPAARGQFVRLVFDLGDRRWLNLDAVIARDASGPRRAAWGVQFLHIPPAVSAPLGRFLRERLAGELREAGRSTAPAPVPAAPRVPTAPSVPAAPPASAAARVPNAPSVPAAPPASAAPRVPAAPPVSTAPRVPATPSVTASRVPAAPPVSTAPPDRPPPTRATSGATRGGAAARRDSSGAWKLRDVTPADLHEAGASTSFGEDATPLRELYRRALAQLDDDGEERKPPRRR